MKSIIFSDLDNAARPSSAEGSLANPHSIAVPLIKAGICERIDGAPSHNSYRLRTAPYQAFCSSPASCSAPPTVYLNSLAISGHPTPVLVTA